MITLTLSVRLLHYIPPADPCTYGPCAVRWEGYVTRLPTVVVLQPLIASAKEGMALSTIPASLAQYGKVRSK